MRHRHRGGRAERHSGAALTPSRLARALAVIGLLALAVAACTRPTHTEAPPLDDGFGTIEIAARLRVQLASDETTGYLIYFERPDLTPAYAMEWSARGRFVMETLQDAAATSQADVVAFLAAQGAEYYPFWVDNFILVERSDRETVDGLVTGFPQILALGALPEIVFPEPLEEIPFDAAGVRRAAVESNIEHVGAPDVWNLGFTGTGIVVASIDTGVRFTHEALVSQYRGNQGGGVFDHNYNWWDPYGNTTTPSDSDNHGSHVTGTMVGHDGADNEIGMAPGAQWIACRGFNPGSTRPGLLECAEFMAAPWDLDEENPNPNLRPHVVNNSWGSCDDTYDNWYQGVVDTWHAAGVYPVFINHNNTNCSYAAPPGLNTVANPGRYGNVTSVGSTGTSNGQYANHSNWGPTDNLDTVNPHPDGYANIKPQVVAPGVSIRASGRNSDTHYYLSTGTSMSAPHVAGLIALMWDAAPCLIGQYAATETILQETARPISYDTGNGDEGPDFVPNHATGWGEIDAPDAVQAAREACNTPPTADAGGPYVGDEGSAIALSGASAADADGDPLTFTWTYAVDAGVGTCSFSDASALTPSFTCNDNGAYTVTLAVSDGIVTVSDSAAVTVANVAPTVVAGPDAVIVSGETFAFSGTFSDPGVIDFPWHYLIDWGDGSTTAGSTSDQSAAIEATHQFCAPGDRTVSLTVTDKDGGVGQDTLTLSVAHLAVAIQITPQQTRNPIRLRQGGRLPVAVFSSATFDATSIDPATVTLGDEVGIDTPVAQRPNGTYFATHEDVDGDGWPDLVVHFEVPALVANGDLTAATSELVLLAVLADACTHIRGVDHVTVVP
jgi:hypothetical protein